MEYAPVACLAGRTTSKEMNPAVLSALVWSAAHACCW